MKYLQRYFSLLCALLLCVGLFSVTAHAKAIDVPTFNIQEIFNGQVGAGLVQNVYTFTPRNSIAESTSIWSSAFTKKAEEGVAFNTTYVFTPLNTDIFIKCGEKVSLSIKYTAVYWCLSIGSTTKRYYAPDTQRILLFYSDGSMEYIDSVQFNSQSFTAEFTPKKDITHFELQVRKDIQVDTGTTFRLGAYLGESLSGDNSYEMTIETESEETGLLKGIIGWLQGIKDGITNLFNSIAELPTKLWDKISEGLKSLFVPSENDMVAYKDKWEELLSSRFGAVYEVGNIMTESWDSVMNADQTNSIEFPSATINLPGGNEFSFGGYTVQVVPNGFSVIITAVKAIVAIVCTVAFVNGMRKRYDEVMGVEQ